jgi:DNA-binding HxlR family transcriptional regulator
MTVPTTPVGRRGNRPAPRDVFRSDCPTRPILEAVTSRWGVLILSALTDGPQRFYELRDRIEGVSEKMLSQNLRVLTRDGLVERTVTPTVPIQVTYRLTALGGDLTLRLRALVSWIGDHTDKILDSQLRHDQAARLAARRGA